MRGVDDCTILERAVAGDYIIVSKDEDFAEEGVILVCQNVWLRCGNLTTPRLMRFLDDRWDDAQRALERGERLVELR